MIKFGTLRTGRDVQHIGNSQVWRKSQNIRTRGAGSHGQQQMFRAEGMATEHADFTGGANRDEMYFGLRKPVFRDTFLSSKFQNFSPWEMQKSRPETCL